MFIIFLDIDGVLNNSYTESKTPTGYVGVDDKSIEILQKLTEYFNAKIVLTSTWKEEWSKEPSYCGEDIKYLKKHLQKNNLFIMDITKDRDLSLRGAGILKWLEDTDLEVEDYIIIDDFSFDFSKYTEISQHVLATKDGIETAYCFDDKPSLSVVKSVELIRRLLKEKDEDSK